MKYADVLSNALAMPITSAPCPKGPYKFVNGEFLACACRDDRDARRRVANSPAREVVLTIHHMTGLFLGPGEFVHD